MWAETEQSWFQDEGDEVTAKCCSINRDKIGFMYVSLMDCNLTPKDWIERKSILPKTKQQNWEDIY